MSRAEAGAGPQDTRPRARSRALLVLGLALALHASALPPALSAEGGTERVSVGSAGADPDGDSHDPAVSADGRYVAFASEAGDLVADDENSTTDVFVFDRTNGTTERVSLDTSGDDANDSSTAPAISADGRYVAFTSAASDLVSGTRMPGSTSSSATASRGRPNASALPPAPVPTPAQPMPRSPPTGATWRSGPRRAISWPATPTASPTSSSTTATAIRQTGPASKTAEPMSRRRLVQRARSPPTDATSRSSRPRTTWSRRRELLRRRLPP